MLGYDYDNMTGSPSPPEKVSVKLINSEVAIAINMSWTATPVIGIHQNYTILLKSHRAETSELYYILELSTFAKKCGILLAYVIAVNGAGESDPSNNVTIPSLPEIEPVTDSLTHQVWKHSEKILVNVSFEVGDYCC